MKELPLKTIDKVEGVIARFTLNIGIFFCLSLLAIILSVCFIIFSNIRTELTFITIVIGGIAAIYTAFYTAQSLRIRSKQEIIKNSFEMIALLSTREIVKLRHDLSSKFNHDKVNNENFYKTIVSDTSIHTALKTLLNLFDNLSIAIQREYVDEKIIHKAFSFVIPNTCKTFMPYINRLREKFRDDRILCEVEKLANAWQENKFLKTGETIPYEYRKK